MCLNTPAHLKDGSTVLGAFQDVAVGARFSPEKSQELRKLKRGETLTLSGTISDWDSLYKQILIDVD